MDVDRKNYIIEHYMTSATFGVIPENEIPNVAEKFGIKETTLKKDLRTLGCVIYKSKPTKLKNIEEYKLRVANLKLKIGNRLPSYVQHKSVRKIISQGLWGKVRTEVLKQSQNQCSVCGYTSDVLTRLHVHEEWSIDEENLIINLSGLSLLCIHCHSLQHWENTYFRTSKKEEWNDVRAKLEMHFMKVNECSQDVLLAHKRLSTMAELQRIAPPIGSRNRLTEHFDRQEHLNNAKWSYSIYHEMPLRDEIISAMQKKVEVLN